MLTSDLSLTDLDRSIDIDELVLLLVISVSLALTLPRLRIQLVILGKHNVLLQVQPGGGLRAKT